MKFLHRDTWLWNTERKQLRLPGELENTVDIVRGGSTRSLGAGSRSNL